MQQTYSLHEAHPTIQQDICLLLCKYIARYLQHIVNTISEHVSQFYQSGSNPGLIWIAVRVSGSSESTVVTRFSTLVYKCVPPLRIFVADEQHFSFGMIAAKSSLAILCK